MLFSGLLANLSSITVALRWIQWVSFLSYTYKALIQNEFTADLVLTGTKFNSTFEVVTELGLENPPLWYCMIGVSLSIVFYLCLGAFLFERSSAPLSKLK